MTNEINEDYLKRETEATISNFCPFGYLDVKEATNIAIQVGENSNWVYEVVSELSESYEMKLSDMDCVASLYERILQEARDEIYEKANYDFCNDSKNGEIYVHSNYMCSSFNYNEDSITELKKKLKKAKVKYDDLSLKTQWFLDQIGIKL